MTALYLSKMLLLETMLIYSLNIELRLSIGIDYSASTLSLSLFKKIQHGEVKQERKSKSNRKYRLFEWRNPRKSKLKHRKDTPENYLTNIRKTRDTGGEALVETIHTIH